MTDICVSCGEYELYYVLSCGDPEVGESKILFYAGDELAELQQEIRTVNAAFKQLEDAKGGGDPDEVVGAQDHLANMLKDYVYPMSNLPSRHLVQAYSIKGKKWTFIRSDKMRNHWRSYDVDKSLLNARGAGADPKQLDRSALSRAFRDSAQKIRDDLRNGITFRGRLAKGAVSGSLSDAWDANWLKWVDAVNDSLTYSDQGQGAHHDLSAGAQLLRGYAGYAVMLGYNPTTNSYGLTGNAEARAVLAEAEARFDGYAPDRDGWHALMNFSSQTASEAGRQGALNFGYFRGKLTITAHAMLGASIFGTAGLEYSPGPNGSVMAKPSMAGAKGEIAAGAFAGVEAGGRVEGALEWQNPGWRVGDDGPIKDAKWEAIISIGVAASANAGIGGEVDFKISFENGKFMFRCKAQLVIGIGAKGALSGLVGFGTMYEFVMYVYHQLKDNDFGYLEFMDESAFHAVVGVVLFAVENGIDAVRAIGDGLEQVIEAVMAPIEEAQKAEDYARKVKANIETLYFAPPEAKGAVLYRLSETFTFSREEHQEAAILAVVGTMQSHREWQKVVERITVTGRKSTAAAGLARLNWIMDGGSQARFNAILHHIRTLPPATIYAGEPVIIRNVA